MKTYKLNQYIPVVNQGNRYLFGINRFISNDEREFVKFNSTQEKIYGDLAQGIPFSEFELRHQLGSEMMDFLLKNNILITGEQDVDSIFSRAKAYYYFNKMGDVQGELSKKSVLVLGSGGIGSHVAWNLTTMGVGHLTLVDFDIVEESNLNRQLMYDLDDLGKLKVDVLKDKLNRINPLTIIDTVVMKIWSQEDLDKLLTLRDYDLVVKSVDSPANFMQWLDNLSAKYNLKYICGITVSSAPMIGPTYIPGRSAQYTDFFVDEDSYLHASGISQSLGVVMYQLSSELSMEAFKILSGKGKLKYINRIYTYDNMNGTVVKLAPRNFSGRIEEDDRVEANFIFVTTILILTITGLVLNLPWMNIVLFGFSILAPFTVYKSLRNLQRSGFVNGLTSFISSLVLVGQTGALQDIGRTEGIIVFSLAFFIGLSIYIMAVLSIINILYVTINRLRKVWVYE